MTTRARILRLADGTTRVVRTWVVHGRRVCRGHRPAGAYCVCNDY